MIASCYRRSGKIYNDAIFIVYFLRPVKFGSNVNQHPLTREVLFFYQATISKHWRRTSQYTENSLKILNVCTVHALNAFVSSYDKMDAYSIVMM